jgi:tRNA(Ile)-lysidine synthase
MDVMERVRAAIDLHGLLRPGQRVVLGVSGGADSLCLMDCLRQLGFDLVVAHLDHQLRPSSAQEAQRVAKLAEGFGLPVFLGQAEVRAMTDEGLSLEEAARLARYRFLTQVAEGEGVARIATGHTAQDQVESILMHLLRGAGPAGLRGMQPRTDLSSWEGVGAPEGMVLIRPLLDVGREETLAYCRSQGLEPAFDESNLDLRFFRNRIRHHLIPVLKTYNPGIEESILRMGEVMTGHTELVDGLVEECWKEVVTEESTSDLWLDRETFMRLPLALQREVLRTCARRLVPSLRDLNFEHVNRALEFIEEKASGGLVPLVGDLELHRFAREIVVRASQVEFRLPAYPQMESTKPQQLVAPCSLSLREGWSLKVEHRAMDPSYWNRVQGLDSHEAALDAQEIRGSLHVRSWKRGDRIQPLGMRGTMKVAALFVNSKVPRPARRLWPLVVDQEGILWVVGLRVDQRCRVTEGTESVLHMRLVRA